MACLAADGRLKEGETYLLESIIGSYFNGTYRWANRATGSIIPTITGHAHITGEVNLLFDPNDPYRFGILI